MHRVCLGYNSLLMDGNEGQGPAPDNALREAAAYRISESFTKDARMVDGFRQALADGQPVAFSVPVYSYRFSEPVYSSGDVRLPFATDHLERGYALCMAGYQDDADPPGRLLRRAQQLGNGLGAQQHLEPGHARIPYAYLAGYGSYTYVARVGNSLHSPRRTG